MDQGLKERLIGAAVLVALGVWLIPWLLDGPDDGATDGPASLQLPIPEVRSADVRTEVIDLNAAREPQSPVLPIGSTDEIPRRAGSSSDTIVADGAAPTVAPTPSAASGGAAAEPRTSATADGPRPTTGNDAPAAAERTADTRTEPTRPAEASDTAVAEAEPPVSPAPAARQTAPSMPSGDWAIQLGSFSDEENARRLAERVAGYGYKPGIYDFRAGGRTMYRVRVGPHQTRSAAEAAASSLSAHGFVAQVVTVE